MLLGQTAYLLWRVNLATLAPIQSLQESQLLHHVLHVVLARILLQVEPRQRQYALHA